MSKSTLYLLSLKSLKTIKMKSLVENHTQSTGPGKIKNVTYKNVVFTSNTRTIFEYCEFIDCTFKNVRHVTYHHCTGHPVN